MAANHLMLKAVSPSNYGDLTGRAVGIDSKIMVTSVSGFFATGEQHVFGCILTQPPSGGSMSADWPNQDVVFVTQRTAIDVRNIVCSWSVDCDSSASFANNDHCRYVEFRFYKTNSLIGQKYFLSQKGFSLLYGDNVVFKFEDLENIQLDDHEFLGLDIYTNGTAHSMAAVGLNFDIVMQRVVS